MDMDGDGWTLGALRSYVEQRFEGIERAIDKAETALNYRLEQMNEFRQQIERERGEFVTVSKHDELDEKIDDLRRTYVSNDKYDALVQRLEQRISQYERWQNKMVGALAFIGLGLPIISALIVYFATHP